MWIAEGRPWFNSYILKLKKIFVIKKNSYVLFEDPKAKKIIKNVYKFWYSGIGMDHGTHIIVKKEQFHLALWYTVSIYINMSISFQFKLSKHSPNDPKWFCLFYSYEQTVLKVPNEHEGWFGTVIAIDNLAWYNNYMNDCFVINLLSYKFFDINFFSYKTFANKIFYRKFLVK